MGKLSATLKSQFRDDVCFKKDKIITSIQPYNVKKNIDFREFCPQVSEVTDIVSCTINVVLSCLQTMLNIEYNYIIKNKSIKKKKISLNKHHILDELNIFNLIKLKYSKKFSLRDVLHYLSKNDSIFKINQYLRISNTGYHFDNSNLSKYKKNSNIINTIKQFLSLNIPVISAIYVSSDYYDSKTGIYEYSNKYKDSLFKYPILIVGYNDNTKSFVFQNSWGKNWGDKGFGYISYKFFKRRKILDTWVITDSQYIDKNMHDLLINFPYISETIKIEYKSNIDNHITNSQYIINEPTTE